MPQGDSAGTPRARAFSVLAAAVIVAAVLAAYWNTLRCPFVFDDEPSILGNPTIRSLWPPSSVLMPPADMTVSGRPVLNLTLAANFAAGGLNVQGYHAVNIGVHAVAALLLFGVVRRTLRRLGAGGRSSPDPDLGALAIALVWALHPLQTESVAYVIQRAESLMGLFYLATLYGFVRAAEARRPAPWLALSAAACLFGMGTKEVAASAPVIVILFDRTFVSGTFREAWRLRKGYYLALAAALVPLALLVASAHGRADTIGFRVGIGWGEYLVVQACAIVRYCALSLWPAPLIFEYGPVSARGPAEAVPAVLFVLALGLGTAVAIAKRSPWGFLGAWFFAILAPTSLLPGVRQMMAEHRMYLPLAALVAAAVSGGWALGGRRSLLVWFAAAAALGVATVRRTRAYASPLALWSDTVAKRPGNPYARNNYGNALLQAGRIADGRAEIEEALRIKPAYDDARNNLGNALLQQGRPLEAIGQYEEALRLHRKFPADVHSNLGVAYFKAGRADEAVAHLREAIRLYPDYADARTNLGTVLLALGRPAEALAEFEAAARLRPSDPRVHASLASALQALGRAAEARRESDRAAALGAGRP